MQADTVYRDLERRAKVDAEGLRGQNRDQIDAERQRLLADMQQQVAALALDLAEHVVRSNLDGSSQARLIDQYIDRLQATTPTR